MLLAIIFTFPDIFAQIPKLFLKFSEKQNKIKSGYINFQRIDIDDGDSLVREQKLFLISTKKDIKYLIYNYWKKYPHILVTSCKSVHTTTSFTVDSLHNRSTYWVDDKIHDAKDLNNFLYPTATDLSIDSWYNHLFQRIPPKINKKNIRYKILYPDQEQDLLTNISREFEFDRKTFRWVQEEFTLTYDKIEQISHKVDVFEQQLYDFIHPDILDTISFTFEKIKKGYDIQYATEQAKKDSVFRVHLCDSVAQSITKNAKWIEDIPQDSQKEALFFMPEWKFPLLSGDTIYSDSINSQFLLIDMWYISCHPCRMAMRELATIDTIYDESLLKILSINVTDKDTAKISQVVKHLNLKSDVAYAYKIGYHLELSKKMGNCQGYPQLYLIDMKTKQVVWHSCGWYAGFTKDIEEIIKK